MGKLDGKSIIVTGAAGAIGGATAKVLAREGANLLLVDINGKGLAERAQELKASGARVESVRADVSRSDQVRSFVEAAQRSYGRIDGLFNNAGIEGHIAPTHEYDEAEFDRVQQVNVKGVFLGMRHVLPLMIAQGGGSHRQYGIDRQRAWPCRRLHLQCEQACGGRSYAHRGRGGRGRRACASTA